MSVASAQTKAIAVRPMHAVDAEAVYRLDVGSVINASSETLQMMAGSIVVNLGFSALVQQLPADEKATLPVNGDASGAEFAPMGNVRYMVKNIEVDGQPVERFTVYPGAPRPLTGRVVKIRGHPGAAGGPIRRRRLPVNSSNIGSTRRRDSRRSQSSLASSHPAGDHVDDSAASRARRNFRFSVFTIGLSIHT